MSSPLAVFGAGSGLGAALARRFGREGFRVALVARSADRLDALVQELAADGIEAAAFPSDLSHPANARTVVEAIREHFGRIDVVSYQPLPGGTAFGPAMAGIRNFVHSLHGEVAEAGVYAGVATLSALIKGSEAYNAMTPEELSAITGGPHRHARHRPLTHLATGQEGRLAEPRVKRRLFEPYKTLVGDPRG